MYITATAIIKRISAGTFAGQYSLKFRFSDPETAGELLGARKATVMANHGRVDDIWLSDSDPHVLLVRFKPKVDENKAQKTAIDIARTLGIRTLQTTVLPNIDEEFDELDKRLGEFFDEAASKATEFVDRTLDKVGTFVEELRGALRPPDKKD